MNIVISKTLPYILVPFIMLVIHWLCVRIYSGFCVPENLHGIIVSFMSTGSPICLTLLTIIEKTSQFYVSSWIIISFLLVSIITTIFNSTGTTKK